jgi:hypothetical protein
MQIPELQQIKQHCKIASKNVEMIICVMMLAALVALNVAE